MFRAYCPALSLRRLKVRQVSRGTEKLATANRVYRMMKRRLILIRARKTTKLAALRQPKAAIRL
jgi:hypothetical protein